MMRSLFVSATGMGAQQRQIDTVANNLANVSIETSNVETFKEMVRMIQVNRAYSTMQKAIGSADDMNQRAITLAEV